MPTTRRQSAAKPFKPQDSSESEEEEEEEEREEEEVDEDEFEDSKQEPDDDDPPAAASSNAVARAPTAAAAQTLYDILDYYTELIFVDRQHRWEHWLALQYFWNLYPGKDVEFGRLAMRKRLAALLIDGCSCLPYNVDDTDRPMIDWRRGYWEQLTQDFLRTHELLLRKDATVVVLGNEENIEELEDEDEDAERAQSNYFTTKVETVRKLLDLATAIQPIHKRVQDRLASEGTTFKRQIVTKQQMRDVIDYAKEMKDQEARGAINALFEQDIESNDKTMSLVDLEQLDVFLNNKPFRLDFVQNKFENLLHNWNKSVFGHDDAALIQIRYNIPRGSSLSQLIETPKSARSIQSLSATKEKKSKDRKPRAKTQPEIAELRRNRHALGGAHGEDPLAEARAVAAGAKVASRKRTIQMDDEEDEVVVVQGKEIETAKRLKFDVQESDSDESLDALALSELPKKMAARRKSMSPSKSVAGSKFAGAPPDPGIFDKRGKVKKRHAWTNEEKDAVKAGIKIHGTGKWKEVKLEYPQQLRNRTSVQIKDCWRTMLRNNEVYEEDYPNGHEDE